MFYKLHLSPAKINRKFYPWSNLGMSVNAYLTLKTTVSSVNDDYAGEKTHSLKLWRSQKDPFHKVMKKLKITTSKLIAF